MRVHLLPALGKRPVGSITRADISRFAGTLSDGRRPYTVARVLASLSAFMTFLVEDGRIRANPATGRSATSPDIPTSERHEIRPFSVPELLEVVEQQRALAPREADLTLVLGLTGLRFGELRGLRVADLLEVPYPALRVSRSVPASRGGGTPIVRERTKTGKARVVPLAEILVPVVRRWSVDKQPSDLLFTAPQGGWISLSNWRRSVRWPQTSRGRRPHDLRHTAATAWLAAGVDVKTVQTWLGHASGELTLNLYGHHLGTDADRAGIARFNGALAERRPTRRQRPAGKRSSATDAPAD
jgi:integrase